MKSSFLTNYSEVKFIDKLKHNLDLCQCFYFSVSFIKKPGLKLLAPNMEAALKRGAKGKLITSTYQNFTDIESLQFFLRLQGEYPEQFSCHIDVECFHDINGNTGFYLLYTNKNGMKRLHLTVQQKNRLPAQNIG